MSSETMIAEPMSDNVAGIRSRIASLTDIEFEVE
jgi:hypothetical protein